MVGEVHRLRIALRDLVALSTLPAAWAGREPSTIAAGLADVLVGALQLDFVFVRLHDHDGRAPIELTRGTAWPTFSTWLESRVADNGRALFKQIIPNVGDSAEPCRGLVVPIGFDGEGGVVAAASCRAEFPNESDQLLLSIAINQAGLAFRSAQLVQDLRFAEERLRQARDELETEVMERTSELRRTETELAHATRLTTLGEMAASIAHEINQPLTAIVANATASLNWLAKPNTDVERVREALADVVKDGHRAAEVIQRVRQLATKSDPKKTHLNVNDVVHDVVMLVRSELQKHRVSLCTSLAPSLPSIYGDRVQLQQVILNLVMNAVEAMDPVEDRRRQLMIRSELCEDRVALAVQDVGVGFDPACVDRLFSAFYTTKPGGMGIGLSISRSIIEGHGGRLCAAPNAEHGATFEFALPAAR